VTLPRGKASMKINDINNIYVT